MAFVFGRVSDNDYYELSTATPNTSADRRRCLLLLLSIFFCFINQPEVRLKRQTPNDNLISYSMHAYTDNARPTCKRLPHLRDESKRSGYKEEGRDKKKYLKKIIKIQMKHSTNVCTGPGECECSRPMTDGDGVSE